MGERRNVRKWGNGREKKRERMGNGRKRGERMGNGREKNRFLFPYIYTLIDS